MNNALSSSLVEQTASLIAGKLCSVGIVGLDSCMNTLDGGLKLRADRPVAHTRLFGGLDALLLGLNVSHVQILSNTSFVSPLLPRHGEVNFVSVAHKARTSYHHIHD